MSDILPPDPIPLDPHTHEWGEDDHLVFREDDGDFDDSDKFIEREMDRLFAEDMEAELYPRGRPSRREMARLQQAVEDNHRAATTNLGQLFREALLKKNKGSK